jgi:predicted ATPase
MTRVALSGSHEVGKTTLVTAITGAVPGIRIAGNIMRRLEIEGFGIRENTTPATLARYLRVQLAQQNTAENENLISDRALVDGLAYVRVHLRFGTARYNWRTEDMDFLEAVARLHAATFDHQVLIPIEFPAPSIQTIDRRAIEFRDSVETELVSILRDGWPIPIIRVTGTVEDRVTALKSLFS